MISSEDLMKIATIEKRIMHPTKEDNNFAIIFKYNYLNSRLLMEKLDNKTLGGLESRNSSSNGGIQVSRNPSKLKWIQASSDSGTIDPS